MDSDDHSAKEQVAIYWRGSVSDLATDIRAELIPSQVEQLGKLLGSEPAALSRIADELESLREKRDKAEAEILQAKDALGAAQRLSTVLVVRVCNALSPLDVREGDEVEDAVRRVRKERDMLRLTVDCGHARDPFGCRKCTACASQLAMTYLEERNQARDQAYAACQVADARELKLHGVAAALAELSRHDSVFWRNVLDNLLLDRLPAAWRPITSVSDYATLATALGAAMEAIRLSNTCAACGAQLLDPLDLQSPPRCEDCHPDEDQQHKWLDQMSRVAKLLERDPA